jgi:hypothetical protein
MLRQFKICSENAISVNCNRLIEDKQDEIAELRINNEEIRIEHLQWDIGNTNMSWLLGNNRLFPRMLRLNLVYLPDGLKNIGRK